MSSVMFLLYSQGDSNVVQAAFRSITLAIRQKNVAEYKTSSIYVQLYMHQEDGGSHVPVLICIVQCTWLREVS